MLGLQADMGDILALLVEDCLTLPEEEAAHSLAEKAGTHSLAVAAVAASRVPREVGYHGKVAVEGAT